MCFRFLYILNVFYSDCTSHLYVYPFFTKISYRTGKYVWEDHRPKSGVWKGTNGGEVISFSGCDDDQTSADTSVRISESFTDCPNL